MAVAVAKFMAGAVAGKVHPVAPSLRGLELQYVCPSPPTVVQGMPVLMTRPPRGGYPDPGAVRVVVWPAEPALDDLSVLGLGMLEVL